MKKIYLIRHGQTDYNLHKIVQGSGVDTDLNETGRKQSEAFFKAYSHIPFDKVYTSALKRSIQTVDQFIKLGIPWESYQGLNEISWGNKDGKIITFNDDTYYFKMVQDWNEGLVDRKIEGGESPLDVVARQKPVLDLIFSREEEKNILICMHGRAMRILLATITNTDLRYMDTFEHHNAGLYLIETDGNAVNLIRRNDLAHLGDLIQE